MHDARDPHVASVSSFHSRYSPLREAERLVDARLSGKKPSLVFVLGGGLNYIGEALSKRLPRAKIALLQPCADFDSAAAESRHDYYWSPASACPVDEAITLAFDSGYMAGGVSVIEWEPVLSRFPDRAAAIRSAVASALAREAADAATRAFWARRWLMNSLAFAGSLGRYASMVPGDTPIVLACAGPGLIDAVPAIRAARGGISLWCLASAHACLAAAGLEPDCVVSTDPGHWNALHLRSALSGGTALAFPPSARVPHALFDRRVAIVPFSTGLSFEDGALAACGTDHARALAAGSASGTALSLAADATTGDIFACGLDFAAHGLIEHAYPYEFDALDEIGSGRADGSLSRRHARLCDRFEAGAGGWRHSRAFSAYAASIAAPEGATARCFRISSSPVDSTIARAGLDRLRELRRGSGTPPTFMDSGDASGMRDRRVSLEAFLLRLARDAEAEVDAALEAKRPVTPDACLTLWALAGRSAAPLIASAARGEAGVSARDDAFFGLSEGLGEALSRLPGLRHERT